jgi:type VI protein secretion system component VasF
MHPITARFSQFMSQTLHCAANTTLPLEDIQRILTRLAEEEQALPLPAHTEHTEQSNDAIALTPQHSTHDKAYSNARFAFYAWADECMFHAQRPDATAWAALSLQGNYFHTLEAGHLFYVRLEEELDAAGIPRIEQGSTLDLPARMERAVHILHKHNVPYGLAAFAQCLLYGFCGQYFNRLDVLHSLRSNAYALLKHTEISVEAPPNIPQKITVPLERLLFLLLPALITVAFGVFCAAVLANLPVDLG